jgi:hypothetical protein
MGSILKEGPMGIIKHPERRNSDRDLAELIRIFENMPQEDFDSFLRIFRSYRTKSSTLRIVRMLEDATALSKIRRLAKFAQKILTSDGNAFAARSH